MFRIRSCAIALAAATSLASAAHAEMGFATGRQGGSQYPVSVALAQIMQKVPGVGTVTLMPGGGASNIVAVNNGQSEMGITLSVSAYDGIKAKPPYKKPTPNITQLFALHAFKIAILVNENSPIKTFKDLAGKKVNTGPKGFTITEIAQHVFGLEKIKVDMQYLGITAAVEQFKDGHLDAIFYSPSDRFAAFIDLAQARKIRLVPLPDALMTTMIKQEPSFYRTQFPVSPDIYRGLAKKVETLGYPNLIIANKDKVSEAQAYGMTKAVAENMEKIAAVEPSLKGFKLKDMAVDVGVPIHPGAMKYFKERGWR